MRYYKKSRGGYIAIISALIITAVIVVIVTALGQMSFLNRSNISDSYFKEKSRALSEACVNTALLRLTENDSYSGGETINVGDDTCEILSVVSTGGGRVISAQAEFQKSFTNFSVTVATGEVSIVSWEEVQNF